MSDENIVVNCDPYQLKMIEQNHNLLQNLRDVITEIQNVEMQQANEYMTLRSINLRVLKHVANELNLPWTYKPADKSVYIHPENVAKIDEKWNKCLKNFSLSHDEMNAYKLIKTDDYVNHYDLTKFIGILVRRDQITRDPCNSEKILRNNDLNKLLGVDGFSGYEVNDMKNYIDHLKYGTGDTLHVDTVRKMYDLECLANLSGTDAACIVFTVLIEIFSKYIQCDDAKMQLNKIHDDNMSYLIKNERYYKDINTIRTQTLPELVDFYEKNMIADSKMDQIARLKCSSMITRCKKKKSVAEGEATTMKRGRKKMVKEECIKKIRTDDEQ